MFDRFVLRNAQRYKDALAFGGLARQCSFARLEASVSRVARALQNLRGLSAPFIAVQCPDLWRHWLLLLALSRLGLASASLPDSEVPEQALALLNPDLIISSGGDLSSKEKILSLDDKWFRKVLAGVEDDGPESYFPPVSVDPNDLCRVSIAAGTDKEFHAIAFSFSEIESAILRLIYQDSTTVLSNLRQNIEKPDLLCTIGAASHSAFLMIAAALASVTTVRETDSQNVGSEVVRGTPLFVVMTPSHLEHLIKILPPSMAPLSQIHLTIVGAALSNNLLEKTLKKLTSHVTIAYGTDECGLVSEKRAALRKNELSVGNILPWASVEIVDENDRPLPYGDVGIIRLRASGMARSYYNEPEFSATRFREGWFYPGDRGFLSQNYELHLTGRVDDLVALGGAKFDLSVIDSILKADPVISDAASFIYRNEKGEQSLYCALITHEDLVGNELSQALRKRYPALPPVTVIWVETIPYKTIGFVDREKLRASVSLFLKAKEESDS
ncbi:AMP-binding protein [Aristophania vespae]|uniref:AMP-binding protein n=1 Tax=Aristophania vespae TaxID=2697033 RepID=A0A6P1NFD7_9PROT|nr:class I adenylate-forming enzyme family protein [Aristophania vespae]QHI96158.1 AMP-binding protein [Aristophania vespae]UMM63945.1 2-succinylbenzoate--CoA ligase [Aristophania vespae]